MSLCSVDSVKVELGIDLADSSQDARLLRMITAASEFISLYCRRVFAAGDGLLEKHARDTVIQVRRPPIRAISSVPEGYVVDSLSAGLLRSEAPLNPFLPTTSLGRGVVEVTYDGGFDSVPAAIEDVCIRIVQTRYQATAAIDAGMVSASEGGVSVGFAASAITSQEEGLSKGIRAILDRYRLPVS